MIIEPMQSEGETPPPPSGSARSGCSPGSTRRSGVDEAVGFGLGGPFAWHSKFRLLNARGQPDPRYAAVSAQVAW